MQGVTQGRSAPSVSTRGCGAVNGFGDFYEHVQEWRAQRLPEALAVLGPARALLVRYGGTVRCELEWPFEDNGIHELEWPKMPAVLSSLAAGEGGLA